MNDGKSYIWVVNPAGREALEALFEDPVSQVVWANPLAPRDGMAYRFEITVEGVGMFVDLVDGVFKLNEELKDK